MNNFLQLLDKGSAQILEPLKRFPIASFSAFIFILMISIKMNFQFNHSLVNQYDEVIKQISIVTFFGFFFLVGLRLMAKNIFISLLGVALLVGIYFYFPDTLREDETIIYFMILVGLFSFIILAPFINYKTSNREFFEWLKHLFYTTLLSAVASILFFIILNVVVGILSGLFEIGEQYRYHEYVSFFSFAFFAPYIFLSILTKEPRGLAIRSYNKIEIFFFKYFLSGLFIAYFIIIYTYLGKMIILSEYPKGLVSINIIAFSALALMTYLFWTPLWNEKNSKYKKVIWIAIILQLILLAVALYLRVDAYGWTFGRLALASFGVWLFGLSLYALFKKEISLKGIFLAIPIIIILNLLFASTISKSSQQEKLGRLLGSVESFSNESNISLRYNISSTIDYLYNNYGTDALFPLMPDIVNEFNNQKSNVLDNCAMSVNNEFPLFATEKLGFKYISKWEWRENKNFVKYHIGKSFHLQGTPLSGGIEISKYDWIVRFHYKKKSEIFSEVLVCEPKNISNQKQLYTLKTDDKEIIIKKEKELLASINIEKFVQGVLNLDKNNTTAYRPFNDNFTQEDFTYVYEDKRVKVKFIFDSFSFSLKDELLNYSGLVMIGRERN